MDTSNEEEHEDFRLVRQNCPVCSTKISAVPGSRDAVCRNCGYKDPCCE